MLKPFNTKRKIIQEAKAGMQVAVSLDKITIGRQVEETDVLYSFVSEGEFRTMKKIKENLSSAEIDLLKEIADKMREQNSMWGI